MTSIKNFNSLISYPDLITYFNSLRKSNKIDKNIKFNQFIFFYLVMEELGILKFEDGILTITSV